MKTFVSVKTSEPIVCAEAFETGIDHIRTFGAQFNCLGQFLARIRARTQEISRYAPGNASQDIHGKLLGRYFNKLNLLPVVSAQAQVGLIKI